MPSELTVVAQEVILAQLQGLPLPGPTEMERLTCKTHRRIQVDLWSLGVLAPEMFPLIVGEKEAALAQEFLDRKPEWIDAFVPLHGRFFGSDRYVVELELLAYRFRGLARPSWAELETRVGLGKAALKVVAADMKNGESEDALLREFDQRRDEFEVAMRQLRKDFPGPRFDVACEMVRGLLGGGDPKIKDVGTKLGIPYDTVKAHRKAVRDAVQKIFPRGPWLRGPPHLIPEVDRENLNEDQGPEAGQDPEGSAGGADSWLDGDS
jgi:hypothetical protein